MGRKHIYRTAISLTITLVIYFGLLIMLVAVEQGAEDTSITGVWEAMWYSIVTLTTVGYGDMYPLTALGKVIGYVFVIGSLGTLGYLIGKVSSIMYAIAENKRLGYKGTNFTHHVVIVGWDSFAKTIVDTVTSVGVKVAIITHNRDNIDFISEKYPKNLVYTLFTDFNNYEVIRKANIESSEMVFINLEEDIEKLVYLLNCKKTFGPEVKYAVLPKNMDLKGTFESADTTYILSKDEIAAKIIASYIFEPDVAEFEEDLMTSTESEDECDLQEYRVVERNPFIDQTYDNAFYRMKEMFNSFLIGMVKTKDGKRILYKNPEKSDLKIELGDYLIILTDGKGEKAIQDAFGIRQGSLS